MTKTGILLLNLGTPAATTITAVRTYLREFLMDPRVIDLPALARFVLVYGLILPFRPFQTARAYQKIWTEQGSPLRIHSLDLAAALDRQLGESFQVVCGMRYGEPSISAALERLKNCQKLLVIPLFPQYSSAATGSAVAEVLRVLQSHWNLPQITILDQFYDHPAFIEALAHTAKPFLKKDRFLLMSYHGLPVRQVKKSGCDVACDQQHPCPKLNEQNVFCYRAQCYATSDALAKALNLSVDRYITSFQSRLGKTPWVKPYTDEQLVVLIQKGIKHLVVICPSFVSDCLETLEEIGMQAREQWKLLGGETFELIPCLNAQAHWVEALAGFINNHG